MPRKFEDGARVRLRETGQVGTVECFVSRAEDNARVDFFGNVLNEFFEPRAHYVVVWDCEHGLDIGDYAARQLEATGDE